VGNSSHYSFRLQTASQVLTHRQSYRACATTPPQTCTVLLVRLTTTRREEARLAHSPLQLTPPPWQSVQLLGFAINRVLLALMFIRLRETVLRGIIMP
jgi:hypothetical protein